MNKQYTLSLRNESNASCALGHISSCLLSADKVKIAGNLFRLLNLSAVICSLSLLKLGCYCLILDYSIVLTRLRNTLLRGPTLLVKK